MHDAISAEKLGTPGIGVMTTNFISAAELMSQVLGQPGYDFAVIEHPVSSATDEGLKARAQATVEAIQRIALGDPARDGVT